MPLISVVMRQSHEELWEFLTRDTFRDGLGNITNPWLKGEERDGRGREERRKGEREETEQDGGKKERREGRRKERRGMEERMRKGDKRPCLS